jgi:2-keto-4-pentenoate hydratase
MTLDSEAGARRALLTSAADIVWEHWRDGRRMAALPEPIRPRTRAEGYAVQAALAARSPRPLFGWKIAATSVAGQRHLNVDGPLAGRLFGERVFEPGTDVPFGANSMRVAEAEFAFRMATDLPPRREPYTVDEALAAVATLHPAIEIPDSRYDDFTIVGAAQLIADDACAHYFVLGPATTEDWRRMDLVEHPVLGIVADRETRAGKGGNVLGDPRLALAWLVNELSGIGVTLRAGEVVTTGTCIVPLPIAPGDRVRADFGVLGGVELQMAGR